MYDLNYFLPGQIWQYNSRIGEENSSLTILAIDEKEDAAIIHIRIDNIYLGTGNYIGHLPISAEALMDSVTNFVRHLETIPDFKYGYDQWKQAFEEGKAAYWKIAVKDVIDSIERIMNKKV